MRHRSPPIPIYISHFACEIFRVVVIKLPLAASSQDAVPDFGHTKLEFPFLVQCRRVGFSTSANWLARISNYHCIWTSTRVCIDDRSMLQMGTAMALHHFLGSSRRQTHQEIIARWDRQRQTTPARWLRKPGAHRPYSVRCGNLVTQYIRISWKQRN